MYQWPLSVRLLPPPPPLPPLELFLEPFLLPLPPELSFSWDEEEWELFFFSGGGTGGGMG